MLKKFINNSHIRETAQLAWPLVLTQVGHIITNIVDTIFLGQLSVTEQAAGILASSLYVLALVFSIGVSFALTPLITTANHDNDVAKKASLFKNSLFLNLVIAILSFAVLFFASPLLSYMQQPPEVVALAIPFYNVLIFSMIPISLFFTSKQYCEGLSFTKMALAISIVGNLLNIILNYCLIYGVAFFPKMGYMGSAWASFIARACMGIAFLVFIFKSPLTNEISSAYKRAKINFKELLLLAKIGLNSGAQFTFEVAAFVAAGLMAGVFGKETIDAHGIALHLASFTYMFGSGIGSAATIRVGNFAAQKNWVEIKNATNAALKLMFLCMTCCALIFVATHNFLPFMFTDEKNVISICSNLILIAALFQLFDGAQVTLVGILRGVEDVKIPTLITLIAYWGIALPLAYILAFKTTLQVYGVWIGLLVSLALVSFGLYWRIRVLFVKNLSLPTKL